MDKSMRTLRFFFLATCSLGIFSISVRGRENVKIIANSRIKASAITSDELKSIFLRETNSLGDGTHVEPVLEKDGPIHESFIKEYLGRSDAALQSYYRSLIFTGKASMPKTVGSDDEVIGYVERTAGAIGYVSAGANTAGVKTLEIK